MSDKEAHLFEVQHPERPAVQVQAVDRLPGPSWRPAVNGETGGRRSPETVRSPTWGRRRSRSGKAGGRHDS